MESKEFGFFRERFGFRFGFWEVIFKYLEFFKW